MSESSRLNAKDKLPMSNSDKLNRAWKFVVLGKFSKAKISQSCKVGSTSVARMRVTLETFKSLYPINFQTVGLDLSWEDAQRVGQDERPKDALWKDRIIKEWTKRLARGFGTRFATQPELAAAAIESYSERLPDELIRQWWDRVERINEAMESYDF
jgi:hypothetical protein